MANRHLARSLVLQSLFEWDFDENTDKRNLDSILIRNAEEFAPGMSDLSFMNTLAKNIIDKQKDIDDIIVKAAPEWPIEKISVIDRNILRIGLFELLFGERNQVPAKVAINEAVELAKAFGGENSSKFVNGVLGAVYKEIGEPGKDEGTKKKKKIEEIPYEKMPLKQLGGAVVYAKDGDTLHLAFVHDIFGHWTLSKGKLEAGEDVESGTKREIKEEIGLDIELQAILGENEYVANHPEEGKIRKHVTYFLAESPFVPVVLEESGGLDNASWFTMDEIPTLNLYDDIIPLITKAINILNGKEEGDPIKSTLRQAQGGSLQQAEEKEK